MPEEHRARLKHAWQPIVEALRVLEKGYMRIYHIERSRQVVLREK